jgi:hypothetical protein
MKLYKILIKKTFGQGKLKLEYGNGTNERIKLDATLTF